MAVEQGRQCRRRSMDGGADDNGQKEGRKEGEKEKERTARRLLTHMTLLAKCDIGEMCGHGWRG